MPYPFFSFANRNTGYGYCIFEGFLTINTQYDI